MSYQPEHGQASLRFFDRLRPNMPIWPDLEFWRFAVKAVIKAMYFSAALGAVWVLLSQWSTQDDGNVARILYMLSFLVDGFFIFTVSLVAFTSGLLQNNWDNIIQGLVEARSEITRKFLWCIILNLSIGILARYIAESGGNEIGWMTYVSFNFFLSTLMGITTAYRVHMMYFVFGKRDYKRYVKEETSSGSHVHRWTFPIRDATKMKGGILPAVLIPPLALSAAKWLAVRYDSQLLLPISYAVASAALIALLGVALRVFDMVKLYGEQERMFPTHELHLMRGPWRPLSKEEEEQIYGSDGDD